MRFAFFLVALSACSNLPEIEANLCGNGVLDVAEDCDGFGRDGLSCLEPGVVGACHLDCSPAANGGRPSCPVGYGCDAQNVCREATGSFEVQPDAILGSAWSVASADLDGDGLDDIISTEQPALIGLAKMRAHYFDRTGVTRGSWPMNIPLATPVAFEAVDTERGKLAYLRGGSVGVLSGETDGSLITDALPSYVLHDTAARVITVSDELIGNSSAIVILSEIDGRRGFYREGVESPVLELVVELPYGVGDLAAEPVTAPLFEDDVCHQVALAFRGAHDVSVHTMCETDEEGKVAWREPASTLNVPLDPPASIERGLIATDLDGDGHLDLLVGSDTGTYAAFGNGESFEVLAPHPLRATSGRDLPMPVAAGDLTGDGLDDFIGPQSLWLSDGSAGTRSIRYNEILASVGAGWTTGVVADFNRDGSLDAVAASDRVVDIDFFNGTSSNSLNPFTVPTDRPVEHLAVGDFDGDRINDLAFVQSASGSDTADEVSVAFGDLTGPPETPKTAARLGALRQLLSFRGGTETTIANLALIYDEIQEDDTRNSGLALLSGTSDRSLPCVVQLSTFGEDGTLKQPFAVALTAGEFSSPGVTDLLTLVIVDPSQADFTYELWFLPDVNRRQGVFTQLGWGFAPDLQPVIDPTFAPSLAVTLAAGDLDGDDIDEVIVAAPDGTGARCLVATAKTTPYEDPRLRVNDPVVLEGPCEVDTQLSVVDLDGDRNRDVIIAHGTPGEARTLIALWGDGSGDLDASALTSLTPDRAEPLAFAFFKQTTERLVAYVTLDEVRLLRQAEEVRHFEDGGAIESLERGSGIVAADINGDGVTDLVVADDGALRVLRAELEAP